MDRYKLEQLELGKVFNKKGESLLMERSVHHFVDCEFDNSRLEIVLSEQHETTLLLFEDCSMQGTNISFPKGIVIDFKNCLIKNSYFTAPRCKIAFEGANALIDSTIADE